MAYSNPIHWRLSRQRFRLSGYFCPRCGELSFAQKRICSSCSIWQSQMVLSALVIEPQKVCEVVTVEYFAPLFLAAAQHLSDKPALGGEQEDQQEDQGSGQHDRCPGSHIQVIAGK